LAPTKFPTAKKRVFKNTHFLTFSFITPEPSRNPSFQRLELSPMAPQVSERRRRYVKVKVELGVRTKDIPSQLTKVSLRSVQRFNLKKNILEFGTTRHPKKDVQGRPRKITPEMERVCPFYTHFLII
jgi:hypothetical protein